MIKLSLVDGKSNSLKKRFRLAHGKIKRLKREILTTAFIGIAACFSLHAHEDWQPTEQSQKEIYRPSPIPERVVLTWGGDPSTSQSVTWRTDTSVKKGLAQIAKANSSGRELKPATFDATTSFFKSDLNEAHYHSVTFQSLYPDTLYVYRVGDGANWSEYYHFKTASDQPGPFSFIYFGDAQNEVRTHWSRVFREAFRDAPRAAFTLHAGDLIDVNSSDAEWGEWHQGPDWVNGTIPVIATPGNHEYRRINQGPEAERFWSTKEGQAIEILVTSFKKESRENKTIYAVSYMGPKGKTGYFEINDGGNLVLVDKTMESLTGFDEDELLGSSVYASPLFDRQRQPGVPKVSKHWRNQFVYPIQDVPNESLKETVYFVDYQGVRIISMDSNKDLDLQVPWLRRALQANPNRWTIVTFHHPIFSPGSDRDNKELRRLWKPLLDEYRVDLVLSGHDHTYARTGKVDPNNIENVPTGYQQAYDPEIGTVYVVSVSGPKMYSITKGSFAKRVAENTQLYQVISVSEKELEFLAYKATGEMYDKFTLQKREGKPNLLIEALTSEIKK